MRPEVLISKPVGSECRAALAARFVLHDLPAAPDPDRLLADVGGRIRGIAGGKVSAAMMARLPALEIIANSGVGVDTIDMATARSRGIRVTNTPGVLNVAVAELTLGLMLALARRIPEGDAFVRSGRWAAGVFPNCSELSGKTLGILGLGRIGTEIAARAAAFGMHIAYHARSPKAGVAWEYVADLHDLARAADWLVVIAPATPETRGIVSRSVLQALGPGGRLVNVARGSLVDEGALIEMLASGGVAGAALDVFENEPNVAPALLALPNVVLSSHRGSHTHETRRAMEQIVVDNLIAHFEGHPLISPVD
jgi:lactate dehydrogenase-like 2-hydroxyacid dehydrogenase